MNRVIMTLDMTPEAFADIEMMAKDTGDNISTILRKSLKMYKNAIHARKHGCVVGMADDPKKLITEFVGFGKV